MLLQFTLCVKSAWRWLSKRQVGGSCRDEEISRGLKVFYQNTSSGISWMHQICLNVICELFSVGETMECQVTLRCRYPSHYRHRVFCMQHDVDHLQISGICIHKLSYLQGLFYCRFESHFLGSRNHAHSLLSLGSCWIDMFTQYHHTLTAGTIELVTFCSILNWLLDFAKQLKWSHSRGNSIHKNTNLIFFCTKLTTLRK